MKMMDHQVLDETVNLVALCGLDAAAPSILAIETKSNDPHGLTGAATNPLCTFLVPP
jgi:hypothetical protein